MRILVTGHLGYIGTLLVPMLLDRGYEVAGLDSAFYADSTFCDGIRNIPEIRKDVRDVEAAELEGYDAVIHLAAIGNDPHGEINPKFTYEINHQATILLASLSKWVGVKRFIFSSSCSNYGVANDQIADEESSLNPLTPYGISQVLAEQDLRELASKDFCPVFLRSAMAYGISPRHRFDLLLNNWMARAVTTGHVIARGGGESWRPLVHAEDIARAFIAVLEAPQEIVYSEAFNIGNSEDNLQINDIAKLVAEAVPGTKVEYARSDGPDSRSYRVSFDKIRQRLPVFQPRWTVRRGAQELSNVYRGANLRVEDFEGNRYQRISRIKYLLTSGGVDPTLRWNKPQTASVG